MSKTIEELEAENEKLLRENCKMKAREINNSPLRGYDGMVDRYEAEIKRLKDILTENGLSDK